jgi:hypothetical protein
MIVIFGREFDPYQGPPKPSILFPTFAKNPRDGKSETFIFYIASGNYGLHKKLFFTQKTLKQ